MSDLDELVKKQEAQEMRMRFRTAQLAIGMTAIVVAIAIGAVTWYLTHGKEKQTQLLSQSEPQSTTGQLPSKARVPGTNQEQEELYLQTWVLYDEVNDKVPIRRKYLEKVKEMLIRAKSREGLSIFLIAHGDSVATPEKNIEVTNSRVWYLDRIIETFLGSPNDKLRKWYSNQTKVLWSCGKRLMIDESLDPKTGESKNRRVQVIATTNPELVRDEYLHFWLKVNEATIDVTNEPGRFSPLTKSDFERLKGPGSDLTDMVERLRQQ